MKIIPRAIIARHFLGRQFSQFILADAHGDDRNFFGLDTGLLQRLVKRDVRIADDRAQNNVRLRLDNFFDGTLNVRASEKNVFLAHKLRAERGQFVLDDSVDAVRPDVILSDEKNPFPDGVITPFDRRNDLLVRRRAGVNDIRRFLQTFVRHRINQQMIVTLDDRLHVFAARRSPAAENRANLFLRDQSLCLFGKRRPVGFSVGNDRLDAPAQQSAFGVDFFNRQHFAVDHGFFADGHRAGSGMKNADFDCEFLLGLVEMPRGESRDDDEGRTRNPEKPEFCFRPASQFFGLIHSALAASVLAMKVSAQCQTAILKAESRRARSCR